MVDTGAKLFTDGGETGIRVRRRTRPAFAAVPHAVARNRALGDKALRLWIVLCCYADWDDRECYPSIDTLAGDMSCHRATVVRAQRELVEAGLLETESGKAQGRPNVYTLVEPDPETGGCSTGAPPGDASARQGGVAPVRHEREPDEREPGNERARAEIALDDPLYGFAHFWETYPKRNGRRLGRGKCEERWRRLSLDDRRAAFRGARNYGAECDASITIAKDPDRWLRDRCWVDWQDPPTTLRRENGVARDPMRNRHDRSIEEELGIALGVVR